MTHIETIESFYRSFQERDYVGMTACYHESIRFSDPVFPDLRGDEARAMWHMLCEQGTDLRVVFSGVEAEGESGGARWDAHYTFSPTGRLVHNKVDARFEFQDGKIIRHVDDFDLWLWTRMALGTIGVITGWSGFARAKVRATADRSLRHFIATHPEYTVPESDSRKDRPDTVNDGQRVAPAGEPCDRESFYCAVQPPSTTSTCPDTKPPAGDAR